MSLVLQSSGGGQITIQEPATASNFTQTLPAATGTLVLSGTTPSLNGISFPAAQSASADANTLDDYEEGTWTPSWGVSGGSWTSSSVVATYTKIGRQVTCNMYWITSAISGSKVNSLDGLPFTSANNGARYAIAITANSIGLSGAIPVSAVNANSTSANMQFSYQSTTGWADFVTSAISSSSTIAMTFTYFTD
jgi:hypothetical protein